MIKQKNNVLKWSNKSKQNNNIVKNNVKRILQNRYMIKEKKEFKIICTLLIKVYSNKLKMYILNMKNMK